VFKAVEGGSSNVASSLAYIQLEKQNARLKEALIRYEISYIVDHELTNFLASLRDVTQENEQEQRRRIAGMEKDVMNVEDLSGMRLVLTARSSATKIYQAQLESTLIKLANADTQIEDLKLQLDDALGAEDLVVQLTERTLMLGEVTTFLRAYISLFL
jgi:dynactin 1